MVAFSVWTLLPTPCGTCDIKIVWEPASLLPHLVDLKMKFARLQTLRYLVLISKIGLKPLVSHEFH